MMQPRSGRFSALVERVSGPVCQPHGEAAEKNIARGTRKHYIRSIQVRVLNEVQASAIEITLMLLSKFRDN